MLRILFGITSALFLVGAPSKAAEMGKAEMEKTAHPEVKRQTASAEIYEPCSRGAAIVSVAKYAKSIEYCANCIADSVENGSTKNEYIVQVKCTGRAGGARFVVTAKPTTTQAGSRGCNVTLADEDE